MGNAELVAEIRARLGEVADPERAGPMQRYLKSSLPCRGVPMPVLRRLCREAFRAHPLPDEAAWRRAVLDLWDGVTFREEWYCAIELTAERSARPYQHPGALDLYRHLIVTGRWWDVVDVVASNRVGPILRSHPAETTPVVRAWADHEDLWLRRTAVICQLGSKGDTDVALLTEVLECNLEDSRHGHEFFVRKAVGWALRQHARVDPDWVRAFVAEHQGQLSGLSRREALKHL